MYSPGFVFDEARVDSWEQYKDYDIGTVVNIVAIMMLSPLYQYKEIKQFIFSLWNTPTL